MKRAVIKEGGKYYEALLGTENDAKAAALLQQLLDFDSSDRTRDVLARHAKRAGRPEVADEILQPSPPTSKKAEDA